MPLATVSTVVEAAESHDLVTLANLKTDLGIDGTDEDDFLARAISQASVAVERYCRRVFAIESVEDVIDWDGLRVRHTRTHASLHASRFPVVSVVSLVEGQASLIADVDFRLDPATGLIYRLSSGLIAPWRIFPVTLQFEAGFDVIPDDLQGAVSKIVSGMRQSRLRDPFLRSESIPGVRDVAYWIPTGADAGHFSPDVAEVLDTYAVPVVGS